jgi:signal peptide peptidase SppA
MNEIWLGTEASYREGLEALKKYEAAQASTTIKADSGSDDCESHYLEVIDGVGIVTVQGALYDATFGLVGKWYGITGYGDIQQAMLLAVKDPEVKSILLVIKSGGGSVNGVNETAQLIANVDKVKPVTTYSPSVMASAALWLGLAAREAYVSDTCIAGSIGTIAVMRSYAEQLKEDGVDARVLRSGKYKALGNPSEPISELAVEKLQEQLDYLTGIFLSYVAERRGVKKSIADASFGQGREFIGSQAVDIGLVDGVRTYATAFEYAKATAPADNKTRIVGSAVANIQATLDNPTQLPGNSMTTHLPTAEQIAAMAGISAETPTTAPTAPVVESPAPDASAADVTAIAELSASVSDLTAKLQASAEETATLKAQVETLQASAAQSAETLAGLPGLTNIVADSIKSMAVALNLQVGDTGTLNPEALAAKHAEVSTLFRSKFKVGGVAATSVSTPEEPPKAVVNPLFLAAAQLNKGR